MEKYKSELGVQSNENIKPLYRGVWADDLANNQELPVGGSMFSKELTTKLKLDFEFFDIYLEGFTEENIKSVYEKNKSAVIDWLKSIPSDIDPYTYFVCYQVQNRISNLLKINLDNSDDLSQRQKIYREKGTPKLSELVGNTECAERAVLGKYLFQKAGIKSSYISGITMLDAKDEDEYPENHSFIVFDNPNKDKSTFIFDIARPRSKAQNIPRVLETDVEFNYDLLKNKEDVLVASTEVLQGGRMYFGVGEPVAGYHNVIEKSN
ncbi:MAG: hypothetical protein PHZ07_05030 [Patescibacteria group bacterium]|nr:hypothetical protein [Patescibacteria group bacterium]MDD4304756.1 hypothetical protein [Patescibacteria group bacterium]MDD4695767.1 hypothetical protein [Patescibacteria group bacterium]